MEMTHGGLGGVPPFQETSIRSDTYVYLHIYIYIIRWYTYIWIIIYIFTVSKLILRIFPYQDRWRNKTSKPNSTQVGAWSSCALKALNRWKRVEFYMRSAPQHMFCWAKWLKWSITLGHLGISPWKQWGFYDAGNQRYFCNVSLTLEVASQRGLVPIHGWAFLQPLLRWWFNGT